MARLPRLVLAGQAHLVLQMGHNGARVFEDAADRGSYLAALREAAATESVQVHAYALLDQGVQLVLTPPSPLSMARFMQAVGRRYVSAYNRRHDCSGTRWDGRYRCGVVEPGEVLLEVLRLVDGLSDDPGITSCGHRTGKAPEPLLTNPPEYWQLGNTPFDREAAYRSLLATGLPDARAEALRRGAAGGWAIGSAAFATKVAEAARRPSRPRPLGRPPRTPR